MILFKRIASICIVACLCFMSFNISTLAAESSTCHDNAALLKGESIVYQNEDFTIVRSAVDNTENESINARSTDYGYAWINSSASGSFTVTTSKSGTIGITLKVESSSNDSWAYMSIQKPDGSYFKNNIAIDPTTGGGEGGIYKIYFASSGTYTIHYIAHTTVGMRLMCWLY